MLKIPEPLAPTPRTLKPVTFAPVLVDVNVAAAALNTTSLVATPSPVIALVASAVMVMISVPVAVAPENEATVSFRAKETGPLLVSVTEVRLAEAGQARGVHQASGADDRIV